MHVLIIFLFAAWLGYTVYANASAKNDGVQKGDD